MRRAGKSVVFSLLFCMIALVGGYAEAASVGLISYGTGTGVYGIQGTALDGLAGMEIDITYDSSSLSKPTIQYNSFLTSQTSFYSGNPAYLNQNQIKIVALSTSTFSGSGILATITFTLKSKVKISPKISWKAIDPKTNPVEVATVPEVEEPTDNQGEVPETPEVPEVPETPEAPTKKVSDGTNTWLSGVTMPSDTAEKKDEVKQPEVAAADALKEPAPTEAGDAGKEQGQPGEPKSEKAKEPKFLAYKGVLETLKAYTGPRQPKEILDLFGQQSKGYRQEPPVFLADGKGVLKVKITPPHDAASAPNVAINKEAQLVSFRRGDENSWVVELRPKKGASQVVLTYFLDDTITEIPLTVAPLLATYNGKPFATLTEADFRQFLARGGDPAAQKGNDLNGDGVFDHLDDYLFAANYLVQTAAAKPAAKEQASPPPAPAAGQKVQPPKKTR